MRHTCHHRLGVFFLLDDVVLHARFLGHFQGFGVVDHTLTEVGLMQLGFADEVFNVAEVVASGVFSEVRLNVFVGGADPAHV